jgi:hypothetical protein
MVFALADLLFFTISPKTAISFVWDFSISKLYTNALLSTLNARAGWNNLNTNEQNEGSILFTNDTRVFTTQPSKTLHNTRGTAGTSSGTAVDSIDLQPTKFKGDLEYHIP